MSASAAVPLSVGIVGGAGVSARDRMLLISPAQRGITLASCSSKRLFTLRGEERWEES